MHFQQSAEFEEKWGKSYPVIVRSWRVNWARIVPMFGYPSEIQRAVYTTNTIESLNMTLRKITKNRSLFPNDEAVFKLMYLALRNISKRWTMPIRDWSAALNQLAILFEGRGRWAHSPIHLHRFLIRLPIRGYLFFTHRALTFRLDCDPLRLLILHPLEATLTCDHLNSYILPSLIAL